MERITPGASTSGAPAQWSLGAGATGTLTARLVRINDLTWSDERGAEISRDLIEVRDGDLVLGEVWVESSEDEAPYAAAVAEFGDVTWL